MNQRPKFANQSVGCSKKNACLSISEAGCDKNHPPIIPLVKPSSSQYFEVYATDGINHDMRERYTEAIDYVNFCHRIMNRLLRKKCSESGDAEEYLHDFKIPETANFLSVLDILLHNTKKNVELSQKPNNSNNMSSPNVKLFNSSPRNKPCGTQMKQTKTLQCHRSQIYSPRDTPQSKIINNNCKKVTNKQGNLSKSLLQNKIKQSNMCRAEPSNKSTDRINLTPSGKCKPEPVNERAGNSTSCEEDDSVRTVKFNAQVDGGSSANKALSPLPEPNKNNIQDDNSDLDKYLITIIQKQIQDFLKSSIENQRATYVNDKKDCLDIDNFKVPTNVHDIDLQNYSTYDEVTVKRELDEISKNLSATSSNASELTCDYKHCLCNNTAEKNYSVTQNEIVTSSISVKDVRKAETDDYPLRRVDYTAPNITSSSIIESKRPVKRISTKPTLMNIATNSDTADDASSSIASDEDHDSVGCKLNCHQKFASSSPRHELTRNIDKVKNAFNIPKKHKTTTHISKLKAGDNQDFTHPLNVNKREINSLDKNALSQMGIFTETGEIKPNVLSLLQEQSKSNQNNERCRAFRKSRILSEQAKKKHADPVISTQENLSVTSLSCASSSDIRSDV